MALTRKEINRLARLSHLEVDDATAANLALDLNRMMQLVAKVQEADTTKLVGTVHVHAGTQPLREDQAIPPTDNLSTGAQEAVNGFVVVPKVIS